MKRWKKLIITSCLVSGMSLFGAGSAQAITCTIEDPDLTGTEVSVERGASSTTVTAEPGEAAVPQAECD